MARYRFVNEHRTQWSVEEIGRVLEVSRSGFYDWKKRPESHRAQENRRLDAAIQMAYQPVKEDRVVPRSRSRCGNKAER